MAVLRLHYALAPKREIIAAVTRVDGEGGARTWSVPPGFEHYLVTFRERWERNVTKLQEHVDAQAPRLGGFHGGLDFGLPEGPLPLTWTQMVWGGKLEPEPEPDPPSYDEIMDPFDALEFPWDH